MMIFTNDENVMCYAFKTHGYHSDDQMDILD